jgi:DNA helicase-2/ATP-dependent DNA helicase PcrA
MLECGEKMGVEHVAVDGDEEKVAEFLDNEIINDCRKWEVTDFGQVAILVRNTRTLKIIDEYLDMPHRVVISTPLDDDLNPRSHLIVQLLQYYFDNKMSFVSVIDSYVDFGLLTPYVRKRLLKIRDEIKSVNEEDMVDALPRLFNNVADILLPKYHEGSSIKHLEEVLNTKDLIDSYRPSSTSEVVIMTLHKSKGLEFDVVYHLNMNEFEIPFKKFDNWVAYYPNEVQDLDLHYVGVTRAKKLCVLVSNSIRHNSNGDAKKGEPSVFLSRNGVEVLRKNYSY